MQFRNALDHRVDVEQRWARERQCDDHSGGPQKAQRLDPPLRQYGAPREKEGLRPNDRLEISQLPPPAPAATREHGFVNRDPARKEDSDRERIPIRPLGEPVVDTLRVGLRHRLDHPPSTTAGRTCDFTSRTTLLCDGLASQRETSTPRGGCGSRAAHGAGVAEPESVTFDRSKVTKMSCSALGPLRGSRGILENTQIPAVCGIMIVRRSSIERPLQETPFVTSRGSRGFTLVEMMIVVAIVGILAMLAVAGFRKLVQSAHVSEATGMVQNIRVAQESYHSETQQYANVSAESRVLLSGRSRVRDGACLGRHLRELPHCPMVCFARARRRAGHVWLRDDGRRRRTDSIPAPPNVANPFPANVTTDWYVIMADGDLDSNPEPNNTHVLGASWTNEIIVDHDGQ